MKRCIEEHTVPSFGTIPAGSLWADDSPYVTDEGKFEFVAEEVEVPDDFDFSLGVQIDDGQGLPPVIAKPKKKAAATRKFGEKASD